MSVKTPRRFHRIESPKEIDSAAIESLVAQGDDVILQYGGPAYTPERLEQIDALCAKHRERIEVRFYGHYQTGFDCQVLRSLKSVTNLSVDCLRAASNLEEIAQLSNVEHLTIGVFELDAKDILGTLGLSRLKSLRLTETRRPIDLGPIASMPRLEKLSIAGQVIHIDAIGSAPALRELTLNMIPRTQKLGFVGLLPSLTTLRLALGGRSDIAELRLPLLIALEIVRVRGFSKIDLSAFTNLRSLRIEDQIQIQTLDLALSPLLRQVRLINCKKLAVVAGIPKLTELYDLRIYRTAIDFKSLLEAGLPASAKLVGLYTGKSKADDALRKKLDSLGYQERSPWLS